MNRTGVTKHTCPSNDFEPPTAKVIYHPKAKSELKRATEIKVIGK